MHRFLKNIIFSLSNCLKEVELAGEVASRTNKLDNQRAAVEIAIIVDNVLNRKPRFLQAT